MSDSGSESLNGTDLKFFPESLFGFLRIVCYFVELSYPVFNVGSIYPCGIKRLSLPGWDKMIKDLIS